MKFLNECLNKTITELPKLDTKFWESTTEAGGKKYYEAQAEANSIKKSIQGSQSWHLLNAWKPEPVWKPTFSQKAWLPEAEVEAKASLRPNPFHCELICSGSGLLTIWWVGKTRTYLAMSSDWKITVIICKSVCPLSSTSWRSFFLTLTDSTTQSESMSLAFLFELFMESVAPVTESEAVSSKIMVPLLFTFSMFQLLTSNCPGT